MTDYVEGSKVRVIIEGTLGGEYFGILPGNHLLKTSLKGSPLGSVEMLVRQHGARVEVLEIPTDPEPPIGSVVLDKDGRAWQRNEVDAQARWQCPTFHLDLNREWWNSDGTRTTSQWQFLNRELGPITVLHVPEEATP